MEKVTRMDGLSENLVNVLLNLIRMIVEGKMRISFMMELKNFLNRFTEKAKFYRFMEKNYRNLLLEHEKFFEVLWGSKSHGLITDGTYVTMQYLMQYPHINNWKTVHVEADRNWAPEDIDGSDLADYEYILLMNGGSIVGWKDPSHKLVDLIEFLSQDQQCKRVYDYIVRVDFNELDNELQLTFFELSYPK